MAGPWYLRSSDGNDGDDGLSWANACATMVGLLGKAVAAGDIIYVDDDHQETFAANTTFTFPGTEGVPNKVIVVTTDTTTAVSDYNCTNQFFDGKTNWKKLVIVGEVYFWGACLRFGNQELAMASGKTCTFERCKLDITNNYCYVAVWDNSTIVLIDTDVALVAASYMYLHAPCNFIWRGGALSGDPNNLIKLSAEGQYVQIIGVDLSSMDGGSIFSVAAADERLIVDLRGIKLHATNPPALMSAAPERCNNSNMTIWDESDNNTYHRFRREYQYGYAMEETTLTVSGKGLYDGTNEYSVKLVSRAAPIPTFHDPWRYHLATKRVTTLGSGNTFTVYVLENGNGGQPAAWDNDEVWLEIIYPDDATAQYNIQTDKPATVTTAPAAQTDDAGRWQNETNGREQKLEVTVANGAGKAGPVEIWICVARTNKTLYVCPEVIVS